MRFKRIKYMFFALLCMCVTPIITHAECDYQRQAELARLASNVQLNYNYDVSSGLKFTLYVTNLTNDLYMVDSYGNYFSGGAERSLVYSSNTVSGFNNKDNISFTIYSNDSECRGSELITKYISFPSFNPYSYNDECQENPNFKYCQTWMDTSSVNYDEFVNELAKYKSNSNAGNDIKPTINLFEQILSYLNKPYIVVTFIILTIFVLLTIIFVFAQKQKYNKR